MIDPEFNPMTSGSFRRDPYPILARVRESHPVAHLSPGLVESWSVLKHDDVQRVLLDPETFSSDRSLQQDPEFGKANLSFLFNNLISAGGEKHRRLRMIANRSFMPKYIERFRPALEAVVDERMDMALSGAPFDLVEDFAAQITVTMICSILGIPKDEMAQIRRWTATLADNSGASTWLPALDPAMVARGQRTGEEMAAYFRAYLDERRRTPRDGDVISDFLTVEVEGERLNEEEVLSMAMLLLLAGNETTTNLMANFVRLLTWFPEQAARLRQDPGLIDGAVEETLRMRNSIRNIDRYATRDVEIGDVTIPAGGLTVVWLTSANRDPEAFPQPDLFLPDRSGTRRHVAFGYGMHMCLGAPLARMETQMVARAISRRARAIELIGEADLGPNANFDVINRQVARFLPR